MSYHYKQMIINKKLFFDRLETTLTFLLIGFFAKWLNHHNVADVGFALGSFSFIGIISHFNEFKRHQKNIAYKLHKNMKYRGMTLNQVVIGSMLIFFLIYMLLPSFQGMAYFILIFITPFFMSSFFAILVFKIRKLYQFKQNNKPFQMVM
jgi:hypothetical protein